MSKRTKVLVTGNFNVVHPGHLRLMMFAKEQGDELWVGISSDRIAGSQAQVAEQFRLEGASAIGVVDHAFVYDEDLAAVLDRLRPDVLVKGKEHENSYNVERQVVEKYGGRLIFSSGETVFSSLDILRFEHFGIVSSPISLPADYMRRHGISRNRISELISQFHGVRVCVLGDLIIDEYITCDSLGMSQEDPTIVVTPVSTERFVGGAGVVASHGSGLGASVSFVSVIGDDEDGEFGRLTLERQEIRNFLAVDKSRPTTRKQRFRSSGKTLLRVNHLSQNPISRELQDFALGRAIEVLEDSDLLVFSDFNHGCLPQNLVDQITNHAVSRGIRIAADSQSSSQIGNVGRFTNTDLLTPTEREARIAMHSTEDGLVVLAEKLRSLTKSKNILLKLGLEGVIVHTGPSSEREFVTDRIGALNRSPVDVAGAGDSLLIASALALVAGGSIWEAALVGSLASAIQVSRVGNIPLTQLELQSIVQ